MSHKRTISPDEERDLIESTERGEWQSVQNLDERRVFWRESAKHTLEELRKSREQVSLGTVVKAIQERRVLSFAFKGGLRTAEPYILGYDQRRVLVLSGIQLSGGTGIGWRIFYVSEMSDVAITKTRFDANSSEYNSDDLLVRQVLSKQQGELIEYDEVIAKVA